MFTIKITYTTGDSFNTHEGLTDLVGHIWEDANDAKYAGKLIKEHYEAYCDANGFRDIKNPTGKEEWFSGKNLKDTLWQYSVRVPDGKDGYVNLHAFWCGYFESLEDVELHIDTSID